MRRGAYNLWSPPAGNRIVSTLSGFFSLDQVADYSREAERAIRDLSGRYGRYRMVIDIRDCSAQSQDVIGAFADHVAGVPRAHRLAIVADSALTRLQIRRVIGRPEIVIFDHPVEAVAWADEDVLVG